MRVRVKICGITRVEDALNAVEHGADAIGLVFYEPSPRNVEILQAIEISNKIPAFVTVVGLFVNAEPDFVREVTSQVKLDLLQFHGDETPQECVSYGLPFIKAIRVKSDTNLVQCAKDFSASKALLLDTYTDGVAGGTRWILSVELHPLAYRFGFACIGNQCRGITASFGKYFFLSRFIKHLFCCLNHF